MHEEKPPLSSFLAGRKQQLSHRLAHSFQPRESY